MTRLLFFQFLLTLSLLGIGLYAVALRRRIAALGNVAVLTVMVALVLIWRPAFATSIALMVGIGRGADLIFYCWVVISFVMILNLHFSIRRQLELTTELARRMALEQPLSTGNSSKTRDGVINASEQAPAAKIATHV